MYKFRLSLLVALCASAGLNAGDLYNLIITNGNQKLGSVLMNSSVQHTLVKELADNVSIVDRLPEGVKNNAITNNVITNNKYVQKIVSKKAVDRSVWAGLSAGGTILAAKGELDTEAHKKIAVQMGIAYGLAQLHVLLSEYGLTSSYVNTDSKLVNDAVYFAAHYLLNSHLGS